MIVLQFKNKCFHTRILRWYQIDILRKYVNTIATLEVYLFNLIIFIYARVNQSCVILFGHTNNLKLWGILGTVNELLWEVREKNNKTKEDVVIRFLANLWFIMNIALTERTYELQEFNYYFSFFYVMNSAFFHNSKC